MNNEELKFEVLRTVLKKISHFSPDRITFEDLGDILEADDSPGDLVEGCIEIAIQDAQEEMLKRLGELALCLKCTELISKEFKKEVDDLQIRSAVKK